MCENISAIEEPQDLQLTTQCVVQISGQSEQANDQPLQNGALTEGKSTTSVRTINVYSVQPKWILQAGAIWPLYLLVLQ